MAKNAVQHKGVAIRLACEAFRVSESCYRYESRQNAENEAIANWLLRLTDKHRNWGFGLCFLYLRNVKPFNPNFPLARISNGSHWRKWLICLKNWLIFG